MEGNVAQELFPVSPENQSPGPPSAGTETLEVVSEWVPSGPSSPTLEDSHGGNELPPVIVIGSPPQIFTEDDDIEVIPIDEKPKQPDPIDREFPAVKIMFFNTDIGRKYRHDIEEFFKGLMTADSHMKTREPLPHIEPRPNFLTPSNVNETEDPKLYEASTVIGSVEICRYCMLDKMGWPMVANMINQTPGIELPQYEAHYLNAFPPPEDAVIVEEKPIKTSKTCFNCGGEGHEKKDCKKPFDMATFKKNQAKFIASGKQYGRYHKSDENKNKRPGILSDKLRRALGLKESELPAHIYKMRQLGYPPGWLQYAEENNSGLAMFDKHGREVDLDGDLMEDGQVPDHRIRDEHNLLYNADKLFEFPGFNVSCPSGTNDRGEGRHSSYPRLNPTDSIENFSTRIKTIQRQDETNKNKRTYSGGDQDDYSSSKRRRLSSHRDMDLSEEEDPAMPIEIINLEESQDGDEQPPLPEQEVETIKSDDDQSQGTAPDIMDTINALEAEKQKILAELEDIDDGATSTPAAKPTTSRLIESRGEDNSREQSTLGQSMSYQIGTPIISLTEYQELPEIGKFSEGITEHLPFENLPESTGTYGKISQVLKDVRVKMNVIKGDRGCKTNKTLGNKHQEEESANNS